MPPPLTVPELLLPSGTPRSLLTDPTAGMSELNVLQPTPPEVALADPTLGVQALGAGELGFESETAKGQELGEQSAALDMLLKAPLALSEDIARTGGAMAALARRASGERSAAILEQGKALGRQKDALTLAAGLEVETAQETALEIRDWMATDQQMRQEAVNMQKLAHTNARQKFGELLQKQRELAQKTVDPNRLWNSRTTEQKVGIAIGMIIHDIGAAMTGSGRRGMDILENAIDNDIYAQREDIAGAQRLLDVETAGFGIEREFAAEEHALLEANRVGKWEIVQNKLMLQKAMTADQKIIANLDATMAEIDQRHISQGVIRGIEWGTQAQLQGMGGQLEAQQTEASIRLQMARGVQQAVPPPTGTQYISGAPPLSTGDATKMKGYLGDQQSAKVTLQELIRLRDEMPVSAYTGAGPYARRMKQKFGEMIDHIRHLKEWGAKFEATEAEVLIKAYLGSKDDPTEWGFLLDSMEEFDRSLDTDLNTTLRGFGLRPTSLQTTGTVATEGEIGFEKGEE
jgi:hypothetical protein